MLSMSDGMIWEIWETSDSTPSMRTIGSLLSERVPIPRTRICGESLPGWAPLLVIVTPGRRPWRRDAALAAGMFSISRLVTDATEPVRFACFWVP